MNNQYVVTVSSKMDGNVLRVFGPFDDYHHADYVRDLVEAIFNNNEFEYNCIEVEKPPQPSTRSDGEELIKKARRELWRKS